ncbi:hypothetical protein CB1_000996011 [Camelus ferus]|nr:hypothetical protein CB1_000996011 [Camelus ferus]
MIFSASGRGNTLKNIEKECNAKIMIRGKGSVKEGKVGRKDGQMLPGEDEPLHALVTANTMENVKKAVEQIRNILKQGIETPEDQNDLRKMQLRELARLNGTLREDDNRILRPWQSSETRSITNTTVCTKCGGAGHIASDCKFQRPGDPQSAQDKARMDKEYLSLMAELGEAPVPASVGSTSGPATTPLASAPRPAAPANNPPPPSRPPWMNSGPSESRPYHGMHGAAAATDEPGPPPTWAPWPSSNGYDAAATYGHDAAAAAASQWAAPASSLWSSSPMATAAAAASASPSAQQQYGFQYPLAMAAKEASGTFIKEAPYQPPCVVLLGEAGLFLGLGPLHLRVSGYAVRFVLVGERTGPVTAPGKSMSVHERCPVSSVSCTSSVKSTLILSSWAFSLWGALAPLATICGLPA